MMRKLSCWVSKLFQSKYSFMEYPKLRTRWWIHSSYSFLECHTVFQYSDENLFYFTAVCQYSDYKYKNTASGSRPVYQPESSTVLLQAVTFTVCGSFLKKFYFASAKWSVIETCVVIFNFHFNK